MSSTIAARAHQAAVPTPFTPGSEFAGIVESVGVGVRDMRPGDVVGGSAMTGAFAERIVVPVARLVHVPEPVRTDLASAAAFRVTYTTAYHALVTFGDARPARRRSSSVPRCPAGIAATGTQSLERFAQNVVLVFSPLICHARRDRSARLKEERRMLERAAGGLGVEVADPVDVVRRAGIAVGGPLSELEALTGGRSSLTYRARTARGAPVVVKVAPPGLQPVRNRDVLRQARVLSALRQVDGVAVPEVLGFEAGAPPEVPPLFVMSFAEGESYEPLQDPGPRPEPAVVRARARAAAIMLAALHAPTPADLGVHEAETGLAAEVERWRAAFATCPLTPDQEGSARRTHDRLLSTLPRPVRSSVLHGDWRLGNMQCVGPEIRAVIDWEIWSVGDGRLDLAWMRNMHDPTRPTAVAPDASSLEPDELAHEYASAGGHVADLAWFDALVRYKQAAASALLVKNAHKRGEASPRIESMRDGVGLLMDAAMARLS